MDPVGKFALVFDILTTAQDWRDRVILASVIAKFPLGDPEMWSLAKKVAGLLQTAKSENDRRQRLYARKAEDAVDGVDLWALDWLSSKGFISRYLHGFDWAGIAEEMSEMVEHDMKHGRSQVESDGKTLAIGKIVTSYNVFVGSEVLNYQRVFKMITLGLNSTDETPLGSSSSRRFTDSQPTVVDDAV